MTKQPIDFSKRSVEIGGSDTAAIMNLSPWNTPLSLWAKKTGKLKDELGNFEAAEIGTELEEYVCRKYTRKTGIKLMVDNRTFRHPIYTYMVGHIDRRVVGQKRGFEAKTCSAWMEKHWKEDDIPVEYVLQCNWYMGLTGWPSWDIAVLIGGQKFLYKQLLYDHHLYEQQVEAARNFMESHILADSPPMAVAGDSETLLHIFPESNPSALQLEGQSAEELDQLVEERLGGLESIRHAKEELEKIEARIKQIIGENESAETQNVRVTWKTQHVKEFVVKAFSKRVLNAKKREG